MANELTVGQLKKALEGVPDDLLVKLDSDSGVDQGLGEIVIEDAHRVTYSNAYMSVDYFSIYANDTDEDDEDDED